MDKLSITNSSPIKNTGLGTIEPYIEAHMSTPKIKGENSKSPLERIKLKKSKRRECTPAYSPKEEKCRYDTHLPLTEKKSIDYKDCQRLNFDMIEMKDGLSGKVNHINMEGDHTHPPQKKFLSLIEESLNEVNENYFGVLGSQTTPDTIFKNIFGEDKERKSTPESHPLNELPYELVLDSLVSILGEVKAKRWEVLSLMVRKDIIVLI